MSNDDEFYDSLDELDDDQHKTPRRKKLAKDMSEIIPYYNRDVPKKHLNIKKNTAFCSPKRTFIVPEPKNKKTYSELFWKKTGQYSDRDKSYSTSDLSRLSSTNRSTSESDICSCFNQDVQNEDQATSSRDSLDKFMLDASHLLRKFPITRKLPPKSVNKTRNCGKLIAPDLQTKLLQLNKRMNYGKNASEKNKIKMNEKFLLRKLKFDLDGAALCNSKASI